MQPTLAAQEILPRIPSRCCCLRPLGSPLLRACGMTMMRGAILAALQPAVGVSGGVRQRPVGGAPGAAVWVLFVQGLTSVVLVLTTIVLLQTIVMWLDVLVLASIVLVLTTTIVLVLTTTIVLVLTTIVVRLMNGDWGRRGGLAI
eukprot:CAMPEP_0173397320 /NCGR_PEP_ID=MMETSP1356-20130122/38006_1 /TAXON_ID=77927 ORGANISM="Hemiselmis virescens, Strain PCC157" /NCGR_SAMPLE_ID=MMETSP1356 /ASSEMBLY_ACC=CAM_ASM_000847 /LENGTH=144 /DNA_ID=CAMNT_0014356551 /DNA_START=47 /DNA_END=482 /DNA_ORIENTATION=-